MYTLVSTKNPCLLPFLYPSKLALASCSGLLLWLRRQFGLLRCDGVGRLYRMVVSGLSLCLRKEGLIEGRINCCSSTVQASRCARHDVLRRLLWSYRCSSTSLPASCCARHDVLRRLLWCCSSEVLALLVRVAVIRDGCFGVVAVSCQLFLCTRRSDSQRLHSCH